MRSDIAAGWAVRWGYKNVWRMPEGYQGWPALTDADGLKKMNLGPREGEIFPPFRMTVLGGQKDRNYLGLNSKTRVFSLSELHTQYLVVLLYDDLSPRRLERPEVYNQLFQHLDRDIVLSKKTRMIAAAVGGINRIVVKYAKRNQIRFPIFSDHSRALHRSLDEPELPCLFLLKKQEDGQWMIYRRKTAPVSTVEELVEWVRGGICSEICALGYCFCGLESGFQVPPR